MLFVTFATTATAGEGTERQTFSGGDMDSSSVACQQAKAKANSWLNAMSADTYLYNVTTSRGECSCDKPKDVYNSWHKRTDSFAWVCTVDATVTRTRKP
ncbi:MAG: hypothetical protein NUV49_01840 [Patescibacteria group bacterium]|nr:hypothetical protein [Patescibacteria group bacterium]